MRIKRHNFVFKKPAFITDKTEERQIYACVVQSTQGMIMGYLKIDTKDHRIINRFGIKYESIQDLPHRKIVWSILSLTQTLSCWYQYFVKTALILSNLCVQCMIYGPARTQNLILERGRNFFFQFLYFMTSVLSLFLTVNFL